MSERKLFAGIDTHKDMHALCVLDDHAEIVCEGKFPTDSKGLAKIRAALVSPEVCVCVAIEGVTSYGYGCAQDLRSFGYTVKEALRPGARPYNPHGKTDEIDAYSAAYSAFLDSCPSKCKQMDGDAQKLSFLVSARDALIKEATALSNTVSGLLVRAPQGVRERYRGLKTKELMEALCRARMLASDTFEVIFSLKALAKQWKCVSDEAAILADHMAQILNARYADLLSCAGIGVVTAAALVAAVGDNPERFHTDAELAHAFGVAPIPASSGKKQGRYRLNRGGNRVANAAIHTIAINRLRNDERTKAFVGKKMSEGKSKREAIRCLKRYIVREVHHSLCRTKRKDTSLPPLRQTRRAHHITLREAAAALNTTDPLLSRLERSIVRDLDLEARYWRWLCSLETLDKTIPKKLQKGALQI